MALEQLFPYVNKTIDMFNGDLDFVRKKLEYIRFGVMKVNGKPFLKQDRFLCETINTDADGNLWVEIKDELPKILIHSKGFSVNMQFIQKEEDMFLKVRGKALVEEYVETVQEIPQDNVHYFENKHRILVRIHLHAADYYKKRTISQYTSMLQNICTLRLKKIFAQVTPE